MQRVAKEHGNVRSWEMAGLVKNLQGMDDGVGEPQCKCLYLVPSPDIHGCAMVRQIRLNLCLYLENDQHLVREDVVGSRIHFPRIWVLIIEMQPKEPDEVPASASEMTAINNPKGKALL